MIAFDTGGLLVQEFSELPAIPDSIELLFADLETSSGHPDRVSTNPWFSCWTIGAAVSFGIAAPVHFVPKELLITGWWRDVLRATKRWVNHHIKYDAHVSTNDLGVRPTCELICTLNEAKLVDSERVYKGGYGLDVLSKVWGKVDIDKFTHNLVPYLKQSKDFGDIALDVLAEYACMDVIANKAVFKYIEENMPEESSYVRSTERSVTSILLGMEQHGVHVDPIEIKKTELETIIKILNLDKKLQVLVGRSFLPTSNKDCYDVLCNQLGLPVLSWTEPDPENPMATSNPSFDWEALQKYRRYPKAPKEVIQAIIDYRECSTFRSLFLEKYGERNIQGVLHATYNQTVRTGRMSCSDPNLQQLSKWAKQLIHPPEGYGIVVADASQIEFRIIVHYIENRRCIEAFNANPWTDFHQFVADLGSMDRDPAKTLNFAMGYGQGKNSTVALIASDENFVKSVIEEVRASGVRPEAFDSTVESACRQRALGIHATYHRDLLPELKPTSRQAELACRKRGYVRNHYGRRRHLNPDFARKAFNTACQGTAGDMVKERMVAVHREVPEFRMVAQVHDELVGYVPLELLEDPGNNLLKKIVSVLNEPDRPLKVPVRWTIGWSPKHWAHAKSKEREMKL